MSLLWPCRWDPFGGEGPIREAFHDLVQRVDLRITFGRPLRCPPAKDNSDFFYTYIYIRGPDRDQPNESLLKHWLHFELRQNRRQWKQMNPYELLSQIPEPGITVDEPGKTVSIPFEYIANHILMKSGQMRYTRIDKEGVPHYGCSLKAGLFHFDFTVIKPTVIYKLVERLFIHFHWPESEYGRDVERFWTYAITPGRVAEFNFERQKLGVRFDNIGMAKAVREWTMQYPEANNQRQVAFWFEHLHPRYNTGAAKEEKKVDRAVADFHDMDPLSKPPCIRELEYTCTKRRLDHLERGIYGTYVYSTTNRAKKPEITIDILRTKWEKETSGFAKSYQSQGMNPHQIHKQMENNYVRLSNAFSKGVMYGCKSTCTRVCPWNQLDSLKMKGYLQRDYRLSPSQAHQMVLLRTSVAHLPTKVKCGKVCGALGDLLKRKKETTGKTVYKNGRKCRPKREHIQVSYDEGITRTPNDFTRIITGHLIKQ